MAATTGPATVTIAGGTTAATATATVSASDVVTGFTNVQPGAHYTSFLVGANLTAAAAPVPLPSAPAASTR